MTALAMGILDSVRFEPVHLEAKTINPPLYQTDSRTVHPINFVFKAGGDRELTLIGDFVGEISPRFFADDSAGDVTWTINIKLDDAIQFGRSVDARFNPGDALKLNAFTTQLRAKILSAQLKISDTDEVFQGLRTVVIDSDL
jgi:hypothetical protein